MSASDLLGLTVAVTADRRADEQLALLGRLGAGTFHAPMIRTVPLAAADTVIPVTRKVLAEPPDVVVLTTGVGVRTWIDAAEAVGLADRLVDAMNRAEHVVTRGPKAMAAALTCGVEVSWDAPGALSAEIVDYLADRVSGKRVVVQRDGSAKADLADTLGELGAQVVDVPVYRWGTPPDGEPADRLIEALVAGTIDAVTFTSPPAVVNLASIASERGVLEQVCSALSDESLTVAALGEATCAALAELGVDADVVPSRPRLGALVRALGDYSAQRPTVTVGRVMLRLGAAAVVVDGEVVELPPREMGVLAELAAQPGAVRAKAELRRKVWADAPDVDDHAVEVTVGRLRRRLPDSLAVQTVPRRGYRLIASLD
ncbi:MAG: uroporphyrinogen-III synthase [Acidimicrobiales bacterium]|nr:uroporphyrinogen-III synthase [Acidimicrobiales bacterium]